MKNEQKKSDNHSRIYIIIIALVLCAMAYCSVRGCGSDDGTDLLYKSSDSTVEQIEKEHAAAGSELDNVTGQLDSAGAAISRADELVERSQECVIRNAASIDECQRIVGECRKIIADSQRIYAEVEETNRTGTRSGGGS